MKCNEVHLPVLMPFCNPLPYRFWIGHMTCFNQWDISKSDTSRGLTKICTLVLTISRYLLLEAICQVRSLTTLISPCKRKPKLVMWRERCLASSQLRHLVMWVKKPFWMFQSEETPHGAEELPSWAQSRLQNQKKFLV